MSNGRFVIANFCDDVRHERGNKFSLMGLYTRDVVLDFFPVVLPKFCAVINVFTPRSRPLTDLTIRAYLDDELMAEMSVLPAELEKGQKAILDAPSFELDRMSLQVIMAFSPLVLNQHGRLRTEIESGSEKIPGSFIHIRLRTPEDQVDQ